jgi:type II secretory pathway pseudopilin PulG
MNRTTYSIAVRGFTLIEAIIYIALFSILIGGAVVAMYSIFEGREHNQTKAMMQEEGDYLIGKINWAVTGSSAITSPGVNTTCVSPASCALTVTKWDGSIGSVDIRLSGATMTLARGVNAAVPLSNTDVFISNLSFTHFHDGDSNPEGVRASFILSARTGDGRMISQEFSTTNYLRR